MRLGHDGKIDLIRNVPLFAECSKKELAEIAGIADEIDLPAGKVLIREGATGYEFFVLIEGTVDVTQGGEKVRSMGPGEFFGEIALLGEARRTATVTATSPVTLVVMHGSDFRVFERDFPEMSEHLKRATAERLERSGG